jgi:hypothetical protein
MHPGVTDSSRLEALGFLVAERPPCADTAAGTGHCQGARRMARSRGLPTHMAASSRRRSAGSSMAMPRDWNPTGEGPADSSPAGGGKLYGAPVTRDRPREGPRRCWASSGAPMGSMAACLRLVTTRSQRSSLPAPATPSFSRTRQASGVPGGVCCGGKNVLARKPSDWVQHARHPAAGGSHRARFSLSPGVAASFCFGTRLICAVTEILAVARRSLPVCFASSLLPGPVLSVGGPLGYCPQEHPPRIAALAPI